MAVGSHFMHDMNLKVNKNYKSSEDNSRKQRLCNLTKKMHIYQITENQYSELMSK